MSLNRSLNPRSGDPVEGSVRDSLLRYLGASFVLLGCLLLAVDGTRWDRLIFSFGGSGHGLHASEVVGLGMAVVGVALLWSRRGSEEEPGRRPE
jgi:hypothetical protein